MNALEEKMKQKDIDKFREDLITWFEREQRILPWRENQGPYRVWVSEVIFAADAGRNRHSLFPAVC